jgi:hypothetical protein
MTPPRDLPWNAAPCGAENVQQRGEAGDIASVESLLWQTAENIYPQERRPAMKDFFEKRFDGAVLHAHRELLHATEWVKVNDRFAPRFARCCDPCARGGAKGEQALARQRGREAARDDPEIALQRLAGGSPIAPAVAASATSSLRRPSGAGPGAPNAVR